MRSIAAVFGVTWAAFWIYWFLSAIIYRRSRPQTGDGKPASVRAEGLGRGVLFRVAVAVVVVVVLRTTSIRSGGGAVHNPLLQAAGLIILFAGLALAVWARVHLGRSWGMPMTRQTDSPLITSGPYGYIRHPIYSGILLGAVGTAIGLDLYALVFAAMAGAYFIYSATVEERIMTDRFPSAYAAYKNSTKMLVPFVF